MATLADGILQRAPATVRSVERIGSTSTRGLPPEIA